MKLSFGNIFFKKRGNVSWINPADGLLTMKLYYFKMPSMRYLTDYFQPLIIIKFRF